MSHISRHWSAGLRGQVLTTCVLVVGWEWDCRAAGDLTLLKVYVWTVSSCDCSSAAERKSAYGKTVTAQGQQKGTRMGVEVMMDRASWTDFLSKDVIEVRGRLAQRNTARAVRWLVSVASGGAATRDNGRRELPLLLIHVCAYRGMRGNSKRFLSCPFAAVQNTCSS